MVEVLVKKINNKFGEGDHISIKMLLFYLCE